MVGGCWGVAQRGRCDSGSSLCRKAAGRVFQWTARVLQICEVTAHPGTTSLSSNPGTILQPLPAPPYCHPTTILADGKGQASSLPRYPGRSCRTRRICYADRFAVVLSLGGRQFNTATMDAHPSPPLYASGRGQFMHCCTYRCTRYNRLCVLTSRHRIQPTGPECDASLPPQTSHLLAGFLSRKSATPKNWTASLYLVRDARPASRTGHLPSISAIRELHYA